MVTLEIAVVVLVDPGSEQQGEQGLQPAHSTASSSWKSIKNDKTNF